MYKRQIEHSGYSVFAGVGERTREGNDFYHEMKDSNVLDKVALVYGQMLSLIHISSVCRQNGRWKGRDMLSHMG